MAEASRAGPRVVVALDFAAPAPAIGMLDQLDPALCRVKIGKELFTAAGPELVRAAGSRGFEVFLDLKFHDIPNTVAGAVRAAAALGVWMVNVHAGGGRRMMEAARAALGAPGHRVPLLIAVTVLTSLTQAELAETGVPDALDSQVLRLARLAVGAGLDGVVCSSREAPLLRSALGAAPVLVTPGIRAADAPADDQRRTLTPRQAVDAGSDFLVIGRPITGAGDPRAALEAITSEISYRPPPAGVLA